jgi:hypothetical protein
MLMPEDDFYHSIPHFSEFNGLTEDHHYRPVPLDWWVVLTDDRDSTRAIEAGQYKEVNRMGAASIVCASLAMDGADCAYVFGGDGATLLVPPGNIEAVLKELSVLKSLATERFGLDLRVGSVGVEEACDSGARIEAARFQLADGKCVAFFRGGGLNVAENRFKGNEEKYGVDSLPLGQPDLDNLSCRWNAVPASLGVALAVLVRAQGADHPATYQQVLKGMESIVEHGLDAANPVKRNVMSYKSWWTCVRDEARQYPSVFNRAFFRKLVGIAVAVISLKWGINPGFYDPKTYAESIPTHSDYRKFDDTLRMIIDCTPAQVEQLEVFFENLYQRGEICYGLHAARESLVTCFVDGTEPGEHIHFVDGGVGGYAMAAKQLKARLGQTVTG